MHPTFVSWLEDYRKQVRREGEQLVKDVAASLLGTIIEDWPGTDRDGVHIYARDRSKHSWYLSYPEALTAVIENTAIRKGKEYSGFTNEGYNKDGRRQARSFGLRGVKTDYVSYSVKRSLVRVLTRHARVRLGGRR